MLLLVFALIFIAVSGIGGVRDRLGDLWNREPTAIPSICDNFEFQGLLESGISVYKVIPVNPDTDGLDECLVMYTDGRRDDAAGRSVYGLVYDLEPVGPAASDLSNVPISGMRRYELRTDHGMLVRLGLAANGPSRFQALATNADSLGGQELVVIVRDARKRPVGLSVFRWRGEETGYQLVGYTYGDWLETRPQDPERYVNEVLVCDRQFPADPNNPDIVMGQAVAWKHGRLTLDPNRGSVSCSE